MLPTTPSRALGRALPWLAVASLCMATSLSVGSGGSQAALNASSAHPVASAATTPFAVAGTGAGGLADVGPLSTPGPRATPGPTTTVPGPSPAAVDVVPVAPRHAAATKTKPSGCCAIGATAARAGLFQDLQNLSGSALNARLDQYVQVGAKVARFQLTWADVQPANASTYDWEYADPVVAGLNARGIQALLVIDTTPAWARASGCNVKVCAPADPNAFATFAAAAAVRYAPQGVHHWEIWNEPNNPLFWQPSPNTSAYTALLKATYSAIHRADPQAYVISGGLAPAATGGGWIAPVQFVSEIYGNGGAGSFDAVGWHPYNYPAAPGDNANGAWNQMAATNPSARSLMVAHGDGGKQIWATEFGAPTCTGDSTCVTEAQQASMITQAFALWRSYSWAGPLICYMYQDTGTDQANRENFFGFVRYDGSQKPAYAAFRAAALA